MGRFEFKNNVAVVTGSAGGIGKCLALRLAQVGCNLALVDQNKQGLSETAQEVEKFNVKVSSHLADLSDPKAVAALPQDIKSAHGRVGLLVNNAGMTLIGDFRQITTEAFDKVMQVNFHAPVHLTRGLLPLMEQEKKAQIVMVSSLFGLIASRDQSAYCASKFALRGFSEALRMDLAETAIGVTLVHPGGVDTDIARSAMLAEGANDLRDARAHAQTFLKLSPDVAARQIMRAIQWRRARVIVGRDAQFMSVIQRFYPVFYQKLMLWGDRRTG